MLHFKYKNTISKIGVGLIGLTLLAISVLTVNPIPVKAAVSPSIRSVGQSPGANSTTCTITKPAGLTIGDLMIAQVFGGGTSTSQMSVNTPEGWTKIREDDGGVSYGYLVSALYWKIADSDDVAASDFSWIITNGASNVGAITAIETGTFDTSTPINANNGQANDSATVTAPTITPSVSDCAIFIFCGMKRLSTYSGYAVVNDNPETWYEAYDVLHDLTPDVSIALGYAIRAETTATGNGTATATQDAHNIGQMIAVAPLPGVIAPTVTTQAASDIEDTTATGNGNITSTGGENCDVRGIVWDLATHGDPGNVAPASSGYTNNVDETGDFGTGAFTCSLTGLPTGDTIYVRAYAHNSEGYDYGDEVNFLTKPAAPTNVSATDGVHTDKVVVTWTKSTGATGYKVYEGINLLDTLGDVATYDDTAAPAGVITPGTASASDGTSSLHVVLSLAGESVADGTSRTYKVVAFNATGDSDDSSTDTGYRTTGALTYQWQRSSADSDADYSNISGATTDPYNDTGGVVTPDGRYYKCILNATGATQQTSTVDRGYMATATPAIVVTNVFLGFGGDWAVLSGTISDDQGNAATEVGFDYGLTDSYGSEWTITGSWTTGDSFIGVVTGLSRATVYHYRAKAYNSAEGWGYGEDKMFSTEGSPVIYEYLNENNDGASEDIYGVNWSGQYFTTGSLSHTVTSFRVLIKRTGSPGTITLSIKHANDSGYPTGADLASGTIDGDVISTSYTWYEIETTGVILEAGEKYAIVIRAVTGDDSNDVQWASDTGGSLANAIACSSTDSGINWSSESPADYLFEVWGEPCLDVESGAVFQDYLEDDDMLFIMNYLNIYAPYYPYDDPAQYFVLQLLDTAGTTVLAQVPCTQWGFMPGSIYLNADTASGLTEGAAYYLRVYGLFSGNPSAQYQLTSEDWLGNDYAFLDSEILSIAYAMEEYYDMELTTSIIGQGIVLNEIGSVAFDLGISYLTTVRPELFQETVSLVSHTDYNFVDNYSAETTWEIMLGEQVVTLAESANTITGIEDKTTIALGILIGWLGCSLFLFGTGHITGGLALGFPFLGLAAEYRVLDITIIGVIAAILAFLTIWSFYWTRT